MRPRHSWLVLFALVEAAAGGCSARAKGDVRQFRATPDTLQRVFDRAQSGDTIVLQPGVYNDVKLGKRSFEPAITIQADGATIAGFRAGGVSGLHIVGGTFTVPAPIAKDSGKLAYGAAMRFDESQHITVEKVHASGPGAPPGAADGPFGEGYGVQVVGGSDINVIGGSFQGLKVGIVVGRVTGFRIADNELAGLRSDGIDVAESRQGVIEGNSCRDTRVRDTEHPDCIQLWSRPTSPPTADVMIRKNHATGHTQGISLFNHTRDGVNDGGFDRITIEDNEVEVAFPNGIALTEGRDSLVRNNKVRTLAGAQYIARITTGDGTIRCGNRVAAGAGKAGGDDPPCSR
ncbi:MAG: right-handed parallel beta-helix repeat-containing protein [Caulobacterales bacterium]|nr:right-handed parallel beta-helix repeat-containing protein [Caulobacterales bacterium]